MVAVTPGYEGVSTQVDAPLAVDKLAAAACPAEVLSMLVEGALAVQKMQVGCEGHDCLSVISMMLDTIERHEERDPASSTGTVNN